MPKRVESINKNNLENLFPNHPYLRLFRKIDWIDYASLLAHIYDFLEEENTRVEYEILRGLLIQFYTDQVENVEVKVADYFQTMIVELQVLNGLRA